MESLNMNNLAKSLPAQNIVRDEQDLLEKFKASAMSITTLYRSALASSKQHYKAGYLSALEDLLPVIQQGVSADGGDGMIVGRIMDWIDARREAMREREGDEDDEDVRETKQKPASSSLAAASSSEARSVNDSRDKGSDKDRAHSKARQNSQSRTIVTLPTPRSPEMEAQGLPSSRSRVSPRLQAPASPSPPPTKTQARPKHRLQQKDAAALQPSGPEPLGNATPLNVNTFSTPLVSYPAAGILPLVPRSPTQAVIGSKRRHGVMLETPVTHLSSGNFDYSVPSAGSGSLFGPLNDAVYGTNTTGTHSSRRRGRGQRAGTLNLNGVSTNRADNGMGGVDMMDVEDENGRERKRVARR